jgi:threonine synthase
MSDKFHYQCIDCRAEYPGDKAMYLCPACQRDNKSGQPPKGVLKTVYRYDHIRDMRQGKTLFDWLQSEHFLPLLPLRGMDAWPKLRVGDTPLYKADKRTSGQADDSFEIYFKDDSQNPTFSFKDRASALVSAWARENGVGTLIAASTGNAGSSLAGICASQGQKSIIVVPAAAPLAKLTQILMYGATMIPVKGTYDEAFGLSISLTAKYGWYNRNTAFNPLTIEGKKTVSFELFRQLGYKVPDRIFIPVGDGVIYSGVCKGFEDLLNLGIIDRMPVAVAVQAAGSSNLISNLKRKSFVASASVTIADSISVDIPQCFNMTTDFIRKYHGETVSVTDQEILDASVHLSHTAGIFCEPAAAAAFAGMLKYSDGGMIPAGTKNVVLLTGSGLKDLSSVQGSLGMPEPVDADVESVEKLVTKIIE